MATFPSNSDGTHLSHRAAERLHNLLTDLGYSLDPLSRVSSLADKLKTSSQVASNLLSGRVEWSMGDLYAVTQCYSKNPSYFLDPPNAPQIPADTSIVTPADGGENTVWRAPSGFLNQSVKSGARLQYLTAISNGFFSVQPVRTMLVYETWPTSQRTGTEVVTNSGYVLQSQDGTLNPYLCVARDRNTAVFSPPHTLDGDSDCVTLNLASISSQSIVGRAIGGVQAL